MKGASVAAVAPLQCSDRPSAAWTAIENSLRLNFESPDIEAAKLLFAVVAAHRIVQYPPAWIMAIAPSGSMKTALLDTLQDLPGVHFVDEVTANTFISGYTGKENEGEKKKARTKKPRAPASYLHRLGQDPILIAADFSTVLAMDKRKRPVILAQLRRIYDGHFSREFGTGENLSEGTWKGRLTLLAGVTPEIDKHFTLFQSLGERFVRVRWPRAGGILAGLRAMRQESSLAIQLRAAVRNLLLPILSQRTIAAPEITRAFEDSLAHLGELVALARAQVSRTRERHDIDSEPEPEGNTRLPQQLAQIGRGWALIEGSAEVTEAGMRIIRRAALDCIPPVRRAALQAFTAGRSPYSIGLPPVLISRGVEDLQAVGLVQKLQNGEAALSAIAIELLRGAGVPFPQSGSR
jgi:hypothetical protein